MKRSELRKLVREEVLREQGIERSDIEQAVKAGFTDAIYFATGQFGQGYKLFQDPKIKKHANAIVDYIHNM